MNSRRSPLTRAATSRGTTTPKAVCSARARTPSSRPAGRAGSAWRARWRRRPRAGPARGAVVEHHAGFARRRRHRGDPAASSRPRRVGQVALQRGGVEDDVLVVELVVRPADGDPAPAGGDARRPAGRRAARAPRRRRCGSRACGGAGRRAGPAGPRRAQDRARARPAGPAPATTTSATGAAGGSGHGGSPVAVLLEAGHPSSASRSALARAFHARISLRVAGDR